MPEIVTFKSAKTLSDETLVKALTDLLEHAKNGEIHRMVCVCVGDSEKFYRVTYCAADLSLIGALNIVLDNLKSSYWGQGQPDT